MTGSPPWEPRAGPGREKAGGRRPLGPLPGARCTQRVVGVLYVVGILTSREIMICKYPPHAAPCLDAQQFLF